SACCPPRPRAWAARRARACSSSARTTPSAPGSIGASTIYWWRSGRLFRQRRRVHLRGLLGIAHHRAGRACLRILRVAQPQVLIAAHVAADAALAVALVLHHAAAGVVQLEQGCLDVALGPRVRFLGVRRLERAARLAVALLADLLEEQF